MSSIFMSDDDDSEEEMYSVTSSKTIYKRSRSRPPMSRKIIVRSDSDEGSTAEYGPVTKWAVDYNNRNFVRSKCHKNKGLHREIQGRPFDWHVEYDNNFFVRSKVNELKGLHRRLPDVRRKYVPDEDDLADATGWEFDCGPEFDQAEQDVTYIPEGRIVARGCYRWYGTKRNNSDFDFSEQEHRDNLLTEELAEELKYGQEFLQADVPHMSEQLKRQHSRGGYRWYEVERNAYDIMPEHVPNAERDPEWRRKHHCNGFQYLDLDMCELDSGGEDRERYVTKGKPFKRTILNKVYELRRRSSPRSARYRTRTSLVPGEGEKTTYHGIPDRFPFQERRSPSLRHVFKRRTDTKKYRTSETGSDYEEHEMEEVERRQELSPKYESRTRHMADQTRRSRGRPAYEDEYRERGRGGRADEYVYKVTPTVEESDVRKRPTKASMKESHLDDDVRQTFETWKENIDTRKHPHEEGRRKEKEKRREDYGEVYGDRNHPPPRGKNIDNRKHPHEEGRRKEKEKRRGEYGEVYAERDHPPPRSKVDDKRSHKPKEYSHSDYESGSSSRNSTTHHREEPTQKSQVEDRQRDKSKAHDHRPHGSKDNRKALDEEFEETSGEKHDGVKKLPPHVQERIGKIRQRMEKSVERLDDKKNSHENDHI